ncbi:hypothetical protein EV646_1161, partial [Kribbella antiqua]
MSLLRFGFGVIGSCWLAVWPSGWSSPWVRLLV